MTLSEYGPGTFAAWIVSREADRVRLYVNGRPCGEGQLKTVTPMNLQVLFAMRPWANWFRGELAELLVYDRSLDDEERSRLDAYLREKYGSFRDSSPRLLLDDRNGERESGEQGERPERPSREKEMPSRAGSPRYCPWLRGLLPTQRLRGAVYTASTGEVSKSPKASRASSILLRCSAWSR